ncbi:membrane protein [Nitrospira sp.]|nr:membrane protein [Nitrospira sp.]
MIDPLGLLMWGIVASVLGMLGLWWIERRLHNASIADVGWCWLLVGVVVWYAVAGSGEPMRRATVAGMAAVYGLRLGLHILVTRVVGRTEDPRYRSLRRRWGRDEGRNLFGYFVLQAGAVVFFSIPFLVVMQSPRPTWSLWEYAGMLVWLVAVAGETAADLQLANFKRKPWNHERVCRDGLWYYSRHPNYFFEWVHWWAYVLMAVGLPNAWLTWLSPLVMGWALVKLTGIPLAEEQAILRRGEEYRRYQQITSAFIPWFPRIRS